MKIKRIKRGEQLPQHVLKVNDEELAHLLAGLGMSSISDRNSYLMNRHPHLTATTSSSGSKLYLKLSAYMIEQCR